MSLVDPVDDPAPTAVLLPITNDPIFKPTTEEAEHIDALKEVLIQENGTTEDLNNKDGAEPGQVNNIVAEPFEPAIVEDELVIDNVVEERDLLVQANSATNIMSDNTTHAVEVDIVVEKSVVDESPHSTVAEPTDATASVEPHVITKAVEPESLDAQNTAVTVALSKEPNGVQPEEESITEQTEVLEVIELDVKSAQDDVTDVSAAELGPDAAADQVSQAQEDMSAPHVEIPSEAVNHGLIEETHVSPVESESQTPVPAEAEKEETAILVEGEQVTNTVEETEEDTSTGVFAAEPVNPLSEVETSIKELELAPAGGEYQMATDNTVKEQAATAATEELLVADSAEIPVAQDEESDSDEDPIAELAEAEVEVSPQPEVILLEAEGSVTVAEAEKEVKEVEATGIDVSSSPVVESVPTPEPVRVGEETVLEAESHIETTPGVEVIIEARQEDLQLPLEDEVVTVPKTAETSQLTVEREEQSSAPEHHGDTESVTHSPAVDLTVEVTSLSEIEEEFTAIMDQSPGELDMKEADITGNVALQSADPESVDEHISGEVSDLVDSIVMGETSEISVEEIAPSPAGLGETETVSMTEGVSGRVHEVLTVEIDVPEEDLVISSSDSGIGGISEPMHIEGIVSVPETNVEEADITFPTESTRPDTEFVVDEVIESVSASIIMEDPASEVIAGGEPVVSTPLSADTVVEGFTQTGTPPDPLEQVIPSTNDAEAFPTDISQEHGVSEVYQEGDVPVEQVAPMEHVSEATELESGAQDESLLIEATEITVLQAQLPVVEDRPKSPWTPSFQVTTVGKGISPEPSIEDVTHSEETVEVVVKREQGPEEEQIVPLSVSDTSVPHVEDAHEASQSEGDAAVETAREVPPLESALEIPRPWTPSYSVHSQGTHSQLPTELPAEPHFEEPSTSETEAEPVVSPSPKASLDATQSWTSSYSTHSQGSPSQPTSEIALEVSQDTTPDVCLEDNEVVQTDELPPMEFAQNSEGQARVEKEETAPILIAESAESALVVISESEQSPENGPSNPDVVEAIAPNSAPRSPVVVLQDVESGISTPLLTPDEIQDEVLPNVEQEHWVHSYSVSSQGSLPVGIPLEPVLSASQVLDAPPTPEIPSIQAHVTVVHEETSVTLPAPTVPVEPHPTLPPQDPLTSETTAEPQPGFEHPKSPWVSSYSVNTQGSPFVTPIELPSDVPGERHVTEATPLDNENLHEAEIEAALVPAQQELERPKSPWVASYSVDTQGSPSVEPAEIPSVDVVEVPVVGETIVEIAVSEELPSVLPTVEAPQAHEVVVEIMGNLTEAGPGVTTDAQDSIDTARNSESTQSLWVPSYSVSSQGSPAKHSADLPSLDGDIDGLSQHSSALSIESEDHILATQAIVDVPEVTPSIISVSEVNATQEVIPEIADHAEEENNVAIVDTHILNDNDELSKSLWVPSYSVSKQGSPASQNVDLPSVEDDTDELAQYTPLGDANLAPKPDEKNFLVLAEGESETTDHDTEIDQIKPTFVQSYSVSSQGSFEETTADAEEAILQITPPVEELMHTSERPKSPWIPSYSVGSQGSPRIPPTDLTELPPSPKVAVLAAIPSIDEGVLLASESGIEETTEIKEIPVLLSTTEAQPDIERPKSPWVPSYSRSSQGSPAVLPSELSPAPAALLVTTELSRNITEVAESIGSVTLASEVKPDTERPKSPWVPSYSINSQGSPALSSSTLSPEISPSEQVTTLAAISTVGPVVPLMKSTAQEGVITKESLDFVVSAAQPDIARPQSPWVPSYSVNSQGSSEVPASSLSPKVIVDATLALNEEITPESQSTEATTEIKDSSAVAADVERPKSPWINSYSVNSQGSPTPESVVLATEVPILASHSNKELSEVSILDDVGPLKSPWVPSYSINTQGSPAIPAAALTPDDVEVVETTLLNVGAREDAPQEAILEAPSIPEPGAPEVTENEDQSPSPWVPSYSVNSQGILAAPLSDLDLAEAITGTPALASVEPLQPKSSWVQSYSIETQGSPAVLPLELPSVEVNSAGSADSSNIDAKPSPIVLLNDKLPAERDESGASRSITPVNDADASERPKSPWTPSYSVTRQGSSTSDGDIDKLDPLPPAIIDAAVNKLSETPLQDETDTPTPKPEPAIIEAEPRHKYKMIGAFPLTPSTSTSTSFRSRQFPTRDALDTVNLGPRAPLPPLDENGVDDEVAPILDATSSSIPRPRVESTASSRFFPGGWISTPAKVVDHGRASLDVAKGEFTSSKPTTPIVEQVTEAVAVATTSTISDEAAEKRARWCLIM